MREIKFRQEYNKKWHYWGFIDDGFVSPLQGVGGEKSYQFTGLKDKNGKEIWEGDILENRAVVCFSRGRFQPRYDGGKAEEMEDEFYLIAEEMEIIGNIYENPNL